VLAFKEAQAYCFKHPVKWYQSIALRNFDLEDMELESTNNGPTAKLPILKLVPQIVQENGTSVTKMSIPATAEEKSNKKNDVKARSLLLMALPNEHQLTFNQYPNEKSMFAAIKTRFRESFDSIFNRLQKIVSRLAILGVVISQEDLNSKFLSSLPPEWNTHVVVWMNKPEIETISIDDLYNNFKIVEQKVKKSVGGSSGAQNLAFMTALSTNISTASVSDNTVYAFMVENPNGSNVLHQDLEQIHEDDLEAMDLKWQLSLLSVRAKKYYQRTGKNIFINANDIAGYDKSKVECYNCHKLGHFARECRSLRSKESQFRNQDNTRKQGNNEDKYLKEMLAIDGVGFDWSDMAEEQIQTNMALMAFSDSENEVLFSEEIAVLKREVACKDYEISVLKSEFEKVKQEKDGIDFKIEKFDKALKDLDQLLRGQITDKSKKGLGYSAVPPPHPLIYNRHKKLDLYYSGLDEFKEPEFKGYGPKNKEQISQDKSSFVESSLNVNKEPVFLVNKKVEFTKPKNHEKPVKKSVRHYYTGRPKAVNTARSYTGQVNVVRGKPQHDDKGFVDSGCSRHMTGNIAYLSDFKEFDGGYVAFGGGAYGGKITGKGTLKTDNLDFEDVYFVNELKFNLFSVSQMCDKKNYVLFTDTECLVLSPNFKLPDENQIILKIPRKDNMYSFGIEQKAMLAIDGVGFDWSDMAEEQVQTNMALMAFSDSEGKQHRASCKSKVLNPITKPLFMLHMDLFGPTFVSSLMHKKYCLVVTDDYSRFTWVFFLTTKDETSEILKNFIKEIENLVDKKVKIIRSDNGTEFKNKVMDDFCREKGIKREYSVARTPQQNGVAERRNRTLIEAARTMLADSKLPTTFWAEAVSTACYVQNRVLVVKPHNKTPYELFRGFKPALSFMRPFGCHVTILNTLDSLGKFDGKSDEGFFIGYSLSSKAFRVYNTRTRRVEENLHIRFLENKPMIEGNGPKWLFDIDSLTQSMNYVPVTAGTISNDSDSPTKDVDNGETKTADDPQKEVEDGPNNVGCFTFEYVQKNQKLLGMSKEVETPRYLSLVVPLTKVGDEAVHKELGDRMERAATTASSLEAEQDSGSGPRCQDTILGDVDAQTRFEITSKQSNDPPLSRGYTLGSGEDINRVRQLQTLVDKKRVIIMESSIRSDLHLDDAEGTDFLSTATIFKELARMGYEKPSQKLTFCKAFFSLQWKQDDELMFDTGILDTDEMPVEAKVDEKDEQSTKVDDSCKTQNLNFMSYW
ncbi:putative ribonuclease H-like domain-containing protein, partial [Tanacetum coccineum]